MEIHSINNPPQSRQRSQDEAQPHERHFSPRHAGSFTSLGALLQLQQRVHNAMLRHVGIQQSGSDNETES